MFGPRNDLKEHHQHRPQRICFPHTVHTHSLQILEENKERTRGRIEQGGEGRTRRTKKDKSDVATGIESSWIICMKSQMNNLSSLILFLSPPSLSSFLFFSLSLPLFRFPLRPSISTLSLTQYSIFPFLFRIQWIPKRKIN